MATKLKNLSNYDANVVPDARSKRFGIVVSDWNPGVTLALLDAAHDSLLRHGVLEEDIVVRFVPGSFELPLGAQFLLDTGLYDAIICLGCVIQGETRHFDFICEAVANGIMNLGMKSGRPVIFGVLTTNTLQQALDRSGGIHGNKGTEAAITAIKMAALRDTL